MDVTVVWCLFRSVDSKNEFYSFTGLAAALGLNQALENSFFEASSLYFMLSDKGRNFKLDITNKISKNLFYYFSYDREKELSDMLESVEIKQINKLNFVNTKNIKEVALSYYEDVICIPIHNDILGDLGFYEVKIACIGGNNMYFECNKEVLRDAKISGPCPLA